MKYIYTIIFCFFIFLSNGLSQTKVIFDPDKMPQIIMKINPAALAEYATCLDIAAEFRLTPHLSLQTELGYFNDIFRNRGYTPNNRMSGYRFAGELRLYFNTYQQVKPNWYIAFSANLNNAVVKQPIDGLILQNGNIKNTTTNVSYTHSLLLTDVLIGCQLNMKKRWTAEIYSGLGLIITQTNNIVIENSDIYLYENSRAYTPLGGGFTIWQNPSVFDNGIYMNLALGLKIGYKL